MRRGQPPGPGATPPFSIVRATAAHRDLAREAVAELAGESNRAAMALYRRCGMRREDPDDGMFVLEIEPEDR